MVRLLSFMIFFILVNTSLPVLADNPVKAKEERYARRYAKDFLTNIDSVPSKIKLKVHEYTDHIICLSDFKNHILVMMVREPYSHLVKERILSYSIGFSPFPVSTNSNMKCLLLYYDNLIYSMMGGKLPPEKPLSSEQHFVKPILSQHWRQFGLHNVFDQQRGSVISGCGAVAIGQIMKHYQHPDTIRHDFGYFDKNKQHRHIKMDGTPIDWNSMKDFYLYNDKDSASLEPLMKCIGIAIQSDYGRHATSTNTRNFKRALTTHFGYSSDMYNASRDNITEETMQTLILQELLYGRPTLLCGGGHIFVCDGIHNNFFHFNMGWGGEFNGWYRFPITTTDINHKAFIQTALLNIIPQIQN